MRGSMKDLLTIKIFNCCPNSSPLLQWLPEDSGIGRRLWVSSYDVK